jgi:hypothetical protein
MTLIEEMEAAMQPLIEADFASGIARQENVTTRELAQAAFSVVLKSLKEPSEGMLKNALAVWRKEFADEPWVGDGAAEYVWSAMLSQWEKEQL